jgi:hypothetical protein
MNPGDYFEFTIITDTTLKFIIGSNGTTQFFIAANSADSSNSHNSNASYEVYIDSVLFVGSRQDVYNALADGLQHDVRIVNNTISAIGELEMCNYAAPGWEYNGIMSKVKHYNSSDTLLFEYMPTIDVVSASPALDGTDALGNPLTVTQDGKSFLNYADNTLEHVAMPRVVQADTGNKLFDGLGETKQISYDNLAYYPDNKRYFADNITREDGKYNQIILHKSDLESRQQVTEERIRESEAVPIMSFQTNKNGAFSPQIVGLTGTLKWVVDGVEQISNNPSYSLVGSTVDVNVFANDVVMGEEFTNLLFNGLDIIGDIDLGYFKANGVVRIESNSGVNDLIFSPLANVCTILYTNNTSIPILNLQNTTLSNCDFRSHSNGSLTTINFSTNVNTCSILYTYSCGSLTSLDFTNVTISSQLFYFSCSSLTSIEFGSNSHIINNYNGSSCPNLTTLNNFQNVTLTGSHSSASCGSLISFSQPSYTTGLSAISFLSCGLNLATVDNLFSSLNTYFSANAPIKDLAVNTSAGTNASPTGGAANTDIVNLDTVVYPNAGFDFTFTIN